MRPDPTFFHELLGQSDWGRCADLGSSDTLASNWLAEQAGGRAAPARWDTAVDALTLPRLLEAAPPEEGKPLALATRRAAAADANGNIYWIGDEPSQLFVRSSGDGRKSRFWPDPRAYPRQERIFTDAPSGPQTVRRYSALAVTTDAWLVASFEDESGEGGIEAFDLVGGGAPIEYHWLEDEPLRARALAAAPCGGLWLLDEESRLFAIDQRLGLAGSASIEAEAELFQPLVGEQRAHAAKAAPPAWDLHAIDPTIDAIAVAALSCEEIAVLSEEAGKGRIYVLEAASRTLISTAAVELGGVHDLAVGKVYLRDRKSEQRVVVTLATGSQAVAFSINSGAAGTILEPTNEKYLLRRHGGRALPVVSGAINYDSGNKPDWVPLAEFPVASFAASVRIVTPVFDALVPATLWDRIRLDGCIPSGTSIEIAARAGDEALDPEMLGEWLVQPRLLLSATGGELAGYDPAAIPVTDPAHGKGSWELLLQHMRGRFLQLSITIVGNRVSSPELRSLRAWYPRQSWAERYLPAVYRADPAPADFIDRFLANMEGTFSTLERRIVDAQALFDPRIAPAESLDWLASWFDVALDPSWTEAQRRMFIAHAARFLSMRGTRRGVETALALAFSSCVNDEVFDDPESFGAGIRVSEKFLVRRLAALAQGSASAAARWTPDEDNVALAERIAIAMGKDHADADERAQPVPFFPPPDKVDEWNAAMTAALGFIPADAIDERARWQAFQQARGRPDLSDLPRGAVQASDADDWASFRSLDSRPRRLWQEFLKARYGRLAALNLAHGSSWTSFEEIALFDHLPATGEARRDWYDFETFLIPADEAAHRFTVLLPVRNVGADTLELARQRELARRIVELEKPAHTAFEVTFYFAMNRIGDARLGLDTTLGEGSRGPELIPPAILGRAYLGESFIGAPAAAEPAGRTRLAC